MQVVNESYSPWPLAASGLVVGAEGGQIGGFLCTTSGTVRLSYGSAGAGAEFVAEVAVTAGVFLPMPFSIPPGSYAYATLGGGAEGTFAVNR